LAVDGRLKGGHDIKERDPGLSSALDWVRAKLSGNEVDDALPVCILFGPQAECAQRIAWCATIAKDSRAALAAHRDSLMPLDGAQMVWNRGGHLIALR